MQDEFDVIDRYFAGFSQSDLVRLGPGDDCAILAPPSGDDVVVSTDTLAAGVHFPQDASGNIVVQRALGANLSDLAAMGANPMAVLSALTLPEAEDGFLQDLSDTFRRECDRWQVPLVGGNLCQGPLSITLTVIGTVPSGSALCRNGARVGDDLYVSGTLGDAAAGLQYLANPVNARDVPDNVAKALIDRYERPVPRLAVGQKLRPLASAAIDISDGFSSDLVHLCQASGVDATVELADLPVSEALSRLFPDERDQLALHGGDDYELCFTADPEHRDVIDGLSSSLGLTLTRVGSMGVAGGGAPLTFLRNGQITKAGSGGYRHFSRADDTGGTR
tara:strand:+ start:11473 stop:12474 length:1002 start_codon:yes stop_codon:yes gene_type:complete